MAVTLTVPQLAAALRLGTSDEETAQATRLLTFGTTAVTRHLAGAFASTPDAVSNEALIRLAAYLYDQPNAGRGDSYANAMRNSGAARILLPYVVHRAGSTRAAVAAAQAAVGSAENPVTGISVDAAAATLTVTFADGSTSVLNLPVGGGNGNGGPHVDQTARNSAAAAQATADANATAIDGIDGLPDTTGTEVGQALTLADAPGNERIPQWSTLANPGFFLSGETVPPDNFALKGGHYLRVPDNGPEEMWVRFAPSPSPWVKLATFQRPLVRPVDGVLPDSEDNQHRLALSGNQLLTANLVQVHAAHGRLVTFQTLTSGGVTIGGTLRAALYAGIHSGVPNGNNFVLNAFAWITNAQAWYLNVSDGGGGRRFVIYSGPTHFIHGDFGDDIQAAPHIHNVGEFYVRNSTPEAVRIANAIVAAQAGSESWVWQPVGLTAEDLNAALTAAITAHNGAADAHSTLFADTRAFATNLRQASNLQIMAADTRLTAADTALQGQIDALQAASGLTISAYSETSTYSRGSSNSIVTHGTGLFIYVSLTSRSANHDPGLFPGYWYNLSEGVAYDVIASGSSVRFAARTLVVDAGTDEVFLCTTSQNTPRDLTYIRAQAGSLGGEFVQLVYATIPRDRLPPVREWILNAEYRKGEIVDSTGTGHVHYIALVDNNSSSIANRKQPGTAGGMGVWDMLFTADNPPPAGGAGASWHWLAHITGGAWVANTARTVLYRSFPIAGYANYSALRTDVLNRTIKQIVVRISQNDQDDADDDHGTSVHPNIAGFYQSSGTWRVFPGHALNVDPVGFTIAFGASNLTITADAAIVSTNDVTVRIGVWA